MLPEAAVSAVDEPTSAEGLHLQLAALCRGTAGSSMFRSGVATVFFFFFFWGGGGGVLQT